MADRGEHRWRVSLATLGPGALMVLLPKCPACIGAYVAVASGLTLDAALSEVLFPVAWVGFAVALGCLAVRAHRRHDFRPLSVAVAGSVMIVGARFDGSSLSAGVGLGVFTIGALWSSLLPRRPAKAPPRVGCAC